MKKCLSNVTLLGLDCVNIERLMVAADIDSIEKYSHFLIKKVNHFMETDFVLVIQYDGFILNPEAWSDDFLKYDYIGAPWWYNDEKNVGYRITPSEN